MITRLIAAFRRWVARRRREAILALSLAASRAVFPANGGSAMRELNRDLVTILRTEAKNQRTPPIDYVIAEDGGRMVRRPDPDIAMAELLEEAAAAIEAAMEARK